MNRTAFPIALLHVVGCIVPLWAAERPADEYLRLVREYADCRLEHGRGPKDAAAAPLFAEALDRHTLKLLEGDALAKAAALKFEEWGIRSHDRMLTSANPMHSEDFYQALYALSEVTGQSRYAVEADRSLAYFLQHCQSPATGLFYWGEHAGWDLNRDAPMQGGAGNTHEFFCPWVLWDRSFRLAPEPCRRFAVGLWEHQIGDHKSGDYSRHAKIDQHGPGTEAPYARHGGMYIFAWAKAFEKTKQPVFLKAIEVVLDGLELSRRDQGMLTARDKKTGARTKYCLTLAISLDDAAPLLPPELGAKLHAAAAANDPPEAAVAAASRMVAVSKKSQNLWSDGYGSSGGQIASHACNCLLRHRQTGLPGYRKMVLDAADAYREGPVNRSFPVYPGTTGSVILLLLGAYELSGEAAYLSRAEFIAHEAQRLFLADGCPLPKASHAHPHFEAVTGADTLMMALLQLWAAKQSPPRKLDLVYTDR